ncbi:MAG: hypothetical protein AUJ20_01625 [Comamonadaceae bacterium CG1_02_60_18]|nr:MAG: hypothetical protein AUJ20_01625 [Comamonadaceae bacterium CG1_02_60_18]
MFNAAIVVSGVEPAALTTVATMFCTRAASLSIALLEMELLAETLATLALSELAMSTAVFNVPPVFFASLAISSAINRLNDLVAVTPVGAVGAVAADWAARAATSAMRMDAAATPGIK